MKKHKLLTNLILGCLIVGLFLTGCRNSENPGSETMGIIKISINNSLSRVINSDDATIAIENTNGYEVIIYNNTTVLSTVLDLSNNTATLSVETGAYTVLVLAGYCTSTEGILLGSGFQELVEVEPSTITDVSLALTSISHSFSVPESITCSEEYEVSITGNTNNQLLRISSGGTTMDNQPYIEIGENSTNMYLNCLVPDSSWFGSVTLTASTISEETNIKFFGSNVKLIDTAHSIDDDLENIGTLNWMWLNNSGIPENISTEVNKNIDFTTADTGINIIIGWN